MTSELREEWDSDDETNQVLIDVVWWVCEVQGNKGLIVRKEYDKDEAGD